MIYKKLSSIADIQAGGTPSRTKLEYWNGNIPWIKISNIKEKYVTSFEEEINEDGLNNSSAKLFPKNTILYTIFATLGRVGILAFEAATNQAIAGINIKDKKITLDYLYYFLKSTEKHVNAIGNGVAQKNINLSILKNLDVPLRSLSNQNQISDTLNCLEQLIEAEEKQLALLNELIKSRFIEMFGDVLRNSKNFQTCHFGEYVYQMNIGPFGSDLKNDCFVPKELSACMVYEQKHAIEKTLNVPTRYISNEKYSHLKRFEIGPGDIIVSCRGTVGECWILPEEAPKGIIHPSLMLIKPNDAVNHEFLMYLLERILSEQTQQGSGVKMAIRAKDLSKIVCIKPSREDQNHFIDFVHLVDKSKFVVHSRYFLCDIFTLFSSTIA